MNKLYSLLITAVICSAASGLVASDKSEKQAIKEALKDTASLYGLGTYLLHGSATALGLTSGVAATDCDRYMAKKNKENFSVLKSLRQEIPAEISFFNKIAARAHIVGVPLAMYFAYNQYKKYKSDK